MRNSPTQYYVVRFPEPLPAKGKITLSISYNILGALTPLPASIKQDEKQYLTYDFSAYVPSVYKTIKQKTKVKFPSSDVPEYTKTEGLTSSADPEKQGSSFTYGTYDTAKVTPGTTYPVSVRYEFNKPLLVASLLERDVEVSHWAATSQPKKDTGCATTAPRLPTTSLASLGAHRTSISTLDRVAHPHCEN